MPDIHARSDSDSRFRRAVHPADRAASARDRRVLRNLRLRCRRGGYRALRSRKAIILSGGPESVYDAAGPRRPAACSTWACRCSASVTGCRPWPRSWAVAVESSTHREFGAAQVRPASACRLLDGLEDNRDAAGRRVLDVWMSHGDHVVDAPPGFKIVAASDNAPLAAMADESRRFYGVQFHPEVTHTLAGRGDPAPFRARDRRLRSDVGHAQHHRGQRGAHPRAGGDGPGTAGIVRGRGFLGAGGAAASCHRQATHLRVRGSWFAAARRRRPGDGDLRRAHGCEGHPCECRGAFPRSIGGRSRPGEEAQDHRPRVRRGVRRGGRPSSRM